MSRETFAMVSQLYSQPISPRKLAAELKGIYKGLIIVEAKCISVNAAHTADTKSCIGAEEWKSLLALHRTLLYEHCDFFMATQHPSATSSMRVMAEKKAMPQRMFRHGILAFLETLRCRWPQSEEFMNAFIYVAFQMLTLFLETVPSFADIWMECLGDVARYRLAIEKEKECRSLWTGIARHWYTISSDRHPTVGRLYHHLGLLEPTSLRMFCYYSKSLTCVIPFPNTRGSLAATCDTIVRDERTIQSSWKEVEARIVTYHAMVFSRYDIARTTAIGKDSLQLLSNQLAKLLNIGPYFAATNMAAVLQLGAQTNALWQVYAATIDQDVREATNSADANVHMSADPLANISPESVDPFLRSAQRYFSDSFNTVALHCNTSESLKDCLSFMHVKLVCLHSLHTLTTRLGHGNRHISDLLHDGDLDFSALARLLNSLARQDSMSAHILECARLGVFPSAERKEDDRPIPEDYIIRGHIWGQFYFPPGWFECQENTREIETSSMTEARVQRVLWLGLFLAFHTAQLHFDMRTHVFSTTTEPSISATMADLTHLAVTGPHSSS